MQFKSRKRLYLQFAKEMAEAGVQLLTVEAAFGDHPFEVTTPENPWHLQLRTSTVLWHKERMVNLGLQRLGVLAPDYHNAGWFDADTTFANGDWAAEAVHALMLHPVIQPFSEAINLNAHEEFMWNCPGSFYAFLTGRGYHQDPPLPLSYIYKGHPGLAWCATRPALTALNGLYDTCVAGSGDTVMCNALKGGWDVYLPSPPGTAMAASMKRWAARCDAAIKANVGYVRGTLLHHWHGQSEARGYEKRWSILAFHQFDEHTDLTADLNGLYRWAGNKPRLEDDIRMSLCARNEDATE